MQLEVPLEVVLASARLGREGGARIVLDPAPATPLPNELYRLLDVVRPNAREAEVITGVRVENRATAREAAQALLARGAGAAAVQAGTEGDLVVWNGDERWLPRIPVDAVDATGAGDAFVAALAVVAPPASNLLDRAPAARVGGGSNEYRATEEVWIANRKVGHDLAAEGVAHQGGTAQPEAPNPLRQPIRKLARRLEDTVPLAVGTMKQLSAATPPGE